MEFLYSFDAFRYFCLFSYKTKECMRKTEEKLNGGYKEGLERKKPK